MLFDTGCFCIWSQIVILLSCAHLPTGIQLLPGQGSSGWYDFLPGSMTQVGWLLDSSVIQHTIFL